MMRTHCGGARLILTRDSCLESEWRCAYCHTVFTQRKRRPRGADPDQCTWVIYCPAHPKR